MEQTLLIVAPFFIIILAGYAAAKTKYVTDGVFTGLAQFVFLVAAPLFVFRAMARSSLLDRSLGNLGEFIGVYFLGAAAALVLGIAAARVLLKSGKLDELRTAIAASHGNLVLLGMPAVTLLLTSSVVTPLVLLIGLNGLVMALLVWTLSRLQGGKGANLGQLVLTQAKNPLFIALVAGIVYGKLDLPLPSQVDQPLQLLGAVLVPCALFAVGGQLARYQLGGSLQPDFVAAAVKLGAFPLAVWLLAEKSTLFSLPASWMWVAVMMAAMPTGFELQAGGRRAGGEVAESTLLLSTLLGAVSVTILVHIVR